MGAPCASPYSNSGCLGYATGQHVSNNGRNYTCTNDNGVTRPVRLGCEETPGVAPGRSIAELGGALGGAARPCKTDADCSGFGTGRCVPANLVFGYLADDDMCIMPGLYYDCPGDAASCTE